MRKKDSKLATNTVWNNNYWLRPPIKADKIFVHHMVAVNWTGVRCGEYFKHAGVSSNYGIGYKGDICQYVEEKHGAYCQGSQYWNRRGISIEVANCTGSPTWKVSDESLESVIQLVADIIKRNNLGKCVYTGNTSGNLCMHKWVANTGCPDPYLSTKFKHIETEVNKTLEGKCRVHERGYWKKGDRGMGVQNIQRFLKKEVGYNGKIGGNYKSKTMRFVKKFQKKYGIEADGLWGKDTQKAYQKIVG